MAHFGSPPLLWGDRGACSFSRRKLTCPTVRNGMEKDKIFLWPSWKIHHATGMKEPTSEWTGCVPDTVLCILSTFHMGS